MSRRTFIAVDLPERVGQELVALGQRLARSWAKDQVRWMPADHMHLTLRFLGDTEDGQIPQVTGLVRECCVRLEPIPLTLAGIGGFPNVAQPRVVWVGVEGATSPLRDLQRRLELGVRELGWEREGRAFRPHLTLGRPRKGATPRDPCWAQIAADPIDFVGASVSLIESQLKPQGAVYQTLDRVSLT